MLQVVLAIIRDEVYKNLEDIVFVGKIFSLQLKSFLIEVKGNLTGFN